MTSFPVSGTLFSRPTTTAAAYRAVLLGMVSSSDPFERAIGWNLLCDHRVTDERLAEFDLLVQRPLTTHSLKNAIILYFEQQVRTRRLPAYVFDRVNAQNILNRRGVVPVISDNTELVRILDLSGLRPVYRWAWQRRHPEFVDFDDSASPARFNAWLSSRLSISFSSRRRFMHATFVAMDQRRREAPFQPVWATAWTTDFVSRYLDRGPRAWLSALGIVRDSVPRWLVVLRYSVSEAGTIARPTQLDAGWWPVHFPSPPCCPIATGGHPVLMRIAQRREPLLPEYIHKEMTHTLRHWEDGGSRLERLDRKVQCDLPAHRLQHYNRLLATYGSPVQSWMPKPV